MIRSVMEGVAFNMKIILDAFIDQGAKINKIRLIGGGAKSKIWRQIIADIYGKDLIIPHLLNEATSMGAALIGGVGVGAYEDFAFVNKLYKNREIVKPNMSNFDKYNKLYKSFKNSYKALVQIYREIDN